MSFRKYLAGLAETGVGGVGKFVIGNASVDYDSFFGSIILAFFLTRATGTLHMALIDCPRADLPLRFEIMEVLSRLKIDAGNFAFREQFHLIPLASIYNLYDHNLRLECERVEYIVDHHDISGPLAARKSLVDKMGSALTILYYLINQGYFQTVAQAVGKGDSFVPKFRQFVEGESLRVAELQQHPDVDVQQIIHAGILLDTFDLDMGQQERWTLFDRRAVDYLQKSQKFGITFEQLSDLKFDPALNRNLTLTQALGKDCKRMVYGDVVVDCSVVYLSPLEFYQHYGQELELMWKEGRWELCILMHIFRGEGGRLQRAMLFASRSEGHFKLIEQFLSYQHLEKKGLLGSWQGWRDPSATFSRKKFDQEFRKYHQKLQSEL